MVVHGGLSLQVSVDDDERGGERVAPSRAPEAQAQPRPFKYPGSSRNHPRVDARQSQKVKSNNLQVN